MHLYRAAAFPQGASRIRDRQAKGHSKSCFYASSLTRPRSCLIFVVEMPGVRSKKTSSQ